MEEKLYKSKEHLDCLDGLKGIGALLIACVWHYQHFGPQEGSPFFVIFRPFYEQGDLLVEVFFVISGFLIALRYSKEIGEHTISFKQYIIKRLKKLLPIMLFCHFLTCILQGLYWVKTGSFFQYPNFDLYHFLLNVFGIQNGILEVGWSFNSPSWYISVLLCCYVVYFLITWQTESSSGIQILKYGAMALVGGIFIVLNWNYPVANPLMGRGFCCFFVGVLVHAVYKMKDILYTLRIGYICLSFLVVTGILVVAFGYSVLGNRHMAVALGIAPALVLTVLFVPWINQILAVNLLVYLGKISMSIYLLHFPIQCVWKIFEVYTGMEINYSRRIVWIAYAVSALIAVALYERFGADKVKRMGSLVIKNYK